MKQSGKCNLFLMSKRVYMYDTGLEKASDYSLYAYDVTE